MKARTPSDAYVQGQKQGIQQGVNGMIAAMTVVLHDKYGFRKQRLSKFHKLVNDQWEAVLEGRITVDDLVELSKELMGENKS